MIEMRFSDWLKRQRTTRRLTQKELERIAGLSLNYVSRIESGRIQLPDEHTRAKFHAALGTSEDDLVAVGILERIPSLDPGGESVYIQADHITPGDRAAEAAHRGIEIAPFRTGDRHAGLRTHLAGYNLSTGQITALLAVLDAFTDDDR